MKTKKEIPSEEVNWTYTKEDINYAEKQGQLKAYKKCLEVKEKCKNYLKRDADKYGALDYAVINDDIDTSFKEIEKEIEKLEN